MYKIPSLYTYATLMLLMNNATLVYLTLLHLELLQLPGLIIAAA